MGGKTYEGRFLREISFPLGGIGADSIGLAGNGRLIDREIFNRPNRQSVNGYTNFAIKAERDGEVLDAIQGNIAVLKSYTCMRLAKGEFLRLRVRRSVQYAYARYGERGARITARRKAACGSGGGGRRYPRHKRTDDRGEEG